MSGLRVAKLCGGFDLMLSLAEGAGLLSGYLQYNTALFDSSTVERMASHFLTLLAGAVKEPELQVSQLPLLPPDEEKLLLSWTRTQKDFPSDMCVSQLVEAQVCCF